MVGLLVYVCFLVCVVLGLKSRLWHVLGRYSTMELGPAFTDGS